MIPKEHRIAGQGAIFLCALLWSTSGLFIRLVDWHPMVIAGSRSLLAALVLLALRCLLPGQKAEKAGVRTLFKNAPKYVICGLFYTATMVSFVIANKMTASANAILLQYAAPVWAMLLAWIFLHERPRWDHWCALVMVSMGMFFVFSGGLAAGSLSGDSIALISGIAFGANTVVLRAKKDSNTADILFFSHIICFVISIPFFFLHPPSMTVNNILCMTYMGIFQLGLASALFAYGIKRIPAVQAMLTATIEPVLNPVWVLLAIGEKPQLPVIAGGSVIIAAVVFSSVVSLSKHK
ncbi:MAG: DMT family transporter [Treponema sp.]|nr:DMT family transporter [Treponema sp.]